jgi:penicillin-binding protein 1A
MVAPIIRDFLAEALKDVPAVPFRAPPGVKLVRVNHKSGLPAGPGDKNVIMEAFKPGQGPVAGAVAADEMEPMPGEDFPPYPEGAQAGVPPAAGIPPAMRRQFPPPPPPAGFPGPSNDRALTSGTGGLY